MSTTTPHPVRVRFAPSPTGNLHIGGLRTALFNWLFAKHTQGSFLLRIEDTDLERNKKEYTDAILGAFAWVNIHADEPIVIQSERFSEHAKVLAALIEQGKAYRCYCEQSNAELTVLEGGAIYKKYDGKCRTNRVHDITKPHAIRFAIPQDITEISWDDMIRGKITISVEELDDFVIARSDGTPMYNFVVVIDDAFMRISHVIRAEEHISNTPKQILLYKACDYTVPFFAHLPLILNASGQKLSKRDAATSVLEYKTMGYLPDALINYLVRLGWAHGDQEIFTRQELINAFTLEGVGKKGSIFDQDKLDWINSVYMRALSDENLYAYMVAQVDPSIEQKLHDFRYEQIIALIQLYKERTKTVRELANELIAIHAEPSTYAEADVATFIDADTATHLRELIKNLESLDTFTVDLLTDTVKNVCKQLSIKLVKVAQPVRLALVGKAASPGIFELLSILGKAESLKRLHNLVRWIEKKG